MAKQKVVIVLAGNKRQFEEYKAQHPEDRCVFGDSFLHMASVEADEVQEIGSFWKRFDAELLRKGAAARVRNANR